MERALRAFILPGIWKAGASFQKVTEACLYWFELMSIVLLGFHTEYKDPAV